jgi:hypothetical protein
MLNYTETKANNYNLVVLINNQSIESGPFNVQVIAAKKVSAAQTLATGVGLVNATAGFPASVTIMPFDKYGNPKIKPCTSKNLELLGSLRMAHYMVYNFL